jgi:hypothetical protein
MDFVNEAACMKELVHKLLSQGSISVKFTQLQCDLFSAFKKDLSPLWAGQNILTGFNML